MKKLLVANYKMNGNINFYEKVNQVINNMDLRDTVVLCPPFVYMPFLKIKNENLFLGAQDITNQVNTKSTGEISPAMLQEMGAKYVIIGHSERRANGETDAQVADKVFVAQNEDLIPIVCVGEKTKESSVEIVAEQVKSALNKAQGKEIVFAYEPIWAIGSGETPTVYDIAKVIELIRKTAKNMNFDVKVLYGGSVNGNNYKELFLSGADGFLMGGVSNKIEEFCKIIKGE